MEWMRTKSVIQRKPTPNAIAAMIVRMPSITTSLLKELCSRLTDRAQAAGDPPAGARVVDDSPCPPGHNTPLPLGRSTPASFKRLLGRRFAIGSKGYPNVANPRPLLQPPLQVAHAFDIDVRRREFDPSTSS